MDPQQRLLLELAFEACEDAGLRAVQAGGQSRPASMSARRRSTTRPSGCTISRAADAYYATGNALSIISNRLSYVFDLHGPSLTIDTACSSSLVALHHACRRCRRARSRWRWSAASTCSPALSALSAFPRRRCCRPPGCAGLSPRRRTATCAPRAASSSCLKTLRKAIADGDRIHAVICGSGVNSDGRNQRHLDAGRDVSDRIAALALRSSRHRPESVAFVEAHGTGTQRRGSRRGVRARHGAGTGAKPSAADRIDQDQYRPYRTRLRPRGPDEGDAGART